MSGKKEQSRGVSPRSMSDELRNLAVEVDRLSSQVRKMFEHNEKLWDMVRELQCGPPNLPAGTIPCPPERPPAGYQATAPQDGREGVTPPDGGSNVAPPDPLQARGDVWLSAQLCRIECMIAEARGYVDTEAAGGQTTGSPGGAAIADGSPPSDPAPVREDPGPPPPPPNTFGMHGWWGRIESKESKALLAYWRRVSELWLVLTPEQCAEARRILGPKGEIEKLAAAAEGRSV